MKFIHCSTYAKACRQAANIISAQVIIKPNAVLGLATGSTPIGVYKQLIDWYNKDDIDFSEVTTFNLDEYVGLAPDHDQSYRYFMEQNFFSHVNIPAEATHVPSGTSDDLELVCADYDAQIGGIGGIDLQLLGIGHNGHIGFNEPGDTFEKTTHVVTLKEETRQANARFFASLDEVPTQAVTMGMKSIMLSRKVLLMACGEEKWEILDKALNGPVTPEVPASILQLHSDLTVVYSDEPAR